MKGRLPATSALTLALLTQWIVPIEVLQKQMRAVTAIQVSQTEVKFPIQETTSLTMTSTLQRGAGTSNSKKTGWATTLHPQKGVETLSLGTSMVRGIAGIERRYYYRGQYTQFPVVVSSYSGLGIPGLSHGTDYEWDCGWACCRNRAGNYRWVRSFQRRLYCYLLHGRFHVPVCLPYVC